MNMAVSYDKFATSNSGGARESLLTLLQGLSKKQDFIVDVFQTPPVNDPPDTNFEFIIHKYDTYTVSKLTWTNQVFVRQQWKQYLKRELGVNHDALITQGALAPISVQIANELNIPSLLFVRSVALSGYEKYDPKRSHFSNLIWTDLGGKVQYPFLWKNFQDYKQATITATHTIANSEFTAEKIECLFGIKSTVIYPPIKLNNYKIEYNRGGYITMVNPRAEYKGGDIFIDIAEELPDEEFLLVGPISSSAIKKRVENLSNVTHWEWCEDMREAYRESKLVVVPSRWEEPFGRVPAEAMVSGIPCVVSNRGGLPEVVGDTGEIVDEINSVDQWIRSIQNAFETHEPQAQKQRVKRFSAENQVKKLSKLIEDLET